MRAKQRLPSGACDTPRRTMSCGGVSPISLSSNRIEPSRGDRAQRGGLAGAVRADQRDDLALVDLERDALQRLDVAVVGVELVDLEEGHRD
jgi:hypothetical protein